MRGESFFADSEKLIALKLPAASRHSFFYRFHSKMTGNEIHSLPNDCAVTDVEARRNYTTAITRANNNRHCIYK